MPPTSPASPSDFAALLRRYRLARGLSQEELAAKAAISVTSVSYLERGLTRLPHRDTVQLLAAALTLTPEEAEAFLQEARRARAANADDASPAPENGEPGEASRSWPPNTRASAAIPSYRLSAPLTPLLGREQDEAAVVHLISRESVRLLTLTGPGGVGKTRLAVQVTRSLRDELGFELVFVDLVAAAQAERVLPIIAQALGVREAGDLPLLDATIAAMGDRRLVLVLDNFEHVLAAAPLCASLLGACPQAKALATSRAALNIRGEHEFRVEPLPVPLVEALPPLAELTRFGAVELLVERAHAIRPDFALTTAEQGRLVATICARLDGLPLAIELAAAQLRHFTLDELASRLDGAASLDLLVGGPRDLADHQRAMRSTLAWSYDLLAPEERRVFRALGVFPGGATPDALAVVAELALEAVTSSLAALVEANLVRRISGQREPRYDQLVIMRAFALERLRADGELEAAQETRAIFIKGLLGEVNTTSLAVQTSALNRLVPEHDNIRAVLDGILERNDLLAWASMSGGLRQFWELRGFAVEGADWLEQLLTRAKAPTTAAEFEALANTWKILMVLNHRLSRFQRAAEAGEHALAIAQTQGEAIALANALNNLANPVTVLGDYERAEELYQKSLAIYRAEGNRVAQETSLLNLGELRTVQGRFEEALAFHDEALAISESLGVGEQEASRALILSDKGETYLMMDRVEDARSILRESQRLYDVYNQPIVLGLLALGRACWRLGNFEEALNYLERSINLSRRQDDVASLAQALCTLVGAALDHGDLSLAHQLLTEAMLVAPRVIDRRMQWRVVERAAGYACRQSAWATAVNLYTAAERGRAATHDLVDPVERDLRARDRAAALDALGERAFAEAVRAGETQTLERSLACARDMLLVSLARD